MACGDSPCHQRTRRTYTKCEKHTAKEKQTTRHHMPKLCDNPHRENLSPPKHDHKGPPLASAYIRTRRERKNVPSYLPVVYAFVLKKNRTTPTTCAILSEKRQQGKERERESTHEATPISRGPQVDYMDVRMCSLNLLRTHTEATNEHEILQRTETSS